MSYDDEWTRESEAAALAALRRAAAGDGPKPIVLGYARQSKSDFDKHGRPIGPSLDQQTDSIERRPEFQGLPIEHHVEPDRSGKNEANRPKFLDMMQRIRTSLPGTICAVACYEQDRLHRNDVEFFLFMAEMAERRILVFDGNGLISNVDKLSWKLKAVVAQEEREKTARKVRDNLAFLKRQGYLLGVVPQGYLRDAHGDIVEDPEAAPVIREIFRLYATGDYSVRSLAEHLNNQGVKPVRGPGKTNHNRPAAVIFTGDVIKDILHNHSYRGMVEIEVDVEIDGIRKRQKQHIDGKHPALVDEQTWDACVQVRNRNLRRTSTEWTKHSYPLTPFLICGFCGGQMHGASATINRQTYLYYHCHNARRSRSAAAPRERTCKSKLIPAHLIEDGIQKELRSCLPSDVLDDAYRAELLEAASEVRQPESMTEDAIRRLDRQLERVRRLFELGEYDEAAFLRRRSEIREQQDRLREQAEHSQRRTDLEWCRVQIFDLVTAWKDADGGERTTLVGKIFDHIEASSIVRGEVRVAAIPNEEWQPFFDILSLERETGLQPSSDNKIGRVQMAPWSKSSERHLLASRWRVARSAAPLLDLSRTQDEESASARRSSSV